MNDMGWLVIHVITHMCLALLVIYVTCLILCGCFARDRAEREKHHE